MATHILAPYPLTGILRDWRSFIEQAEEASTFQVASEVLRALAREDSARILYSDAWRDYERDHDGTRLCYGLCAVLDELAEASSIWSRVAAYLDEELKQQADKYLQRLRDASQHQFQRVSFLQWTVQVDVQEVAKMHKVLLSISVLDEQEEGEESNE